jgi:hypothetical protein
MTTRTIETEGERGRLARFIKSQPLPFTIVIKDGRMRSVNQNHLQWLWAAQASEQRQDISFTSVQSEWKLLYGVPILCAGDEEFAAMWQIAEAKLSHEEKLKLMQYIPVTSIMSMKQLAQYLDEVYRANVEVGIELTDPEDLKWGKTK